MSSHIFLVPHQNILNYFYFSQFIQCLETHKGWGHSNHSLVLNQTPMLSQGRKRNESHALKYWLWIKWWVSKEKTCATREEGKVIVTKPLSRENQICYKCKKSSHYEVNIWTVKSHMKSHKKNSHYLLSQINQLMQHILYVFINLNKYQYY